mmetsp:Transcript_1460/g.4417  ORF Transcript_1460/g.4417 Transcript_1460/m.4417 type:complete len:302 (-) Transcript_1460:79-984(-)
MLLLLLLLAIRAGESSYEGPGWLVGGGAGGGCSVPSFYEALPRHRNQDVPTRLEVLLKSPLEHVEGFSFCLSKAANSVKGKVAALVRAGDVQMIGSVDDKGQLEAVAETKALANGLTLRVKGSKSRSDGASAVFSAAYTMTSPRATGHIAFDESRLFVSGVVGTPRALFGISTDFDADTGYVREPTLLAKFIGPSYNLTAFGNAGGGKAEIGIEQRITSSLRAHAGLACSGSSLKSGNSVVVALQQRWNASKVNMRMDSSSQSVTASGALRGVIPNVMLFGSMKVDSSLKCVFGFNAKVVV